MSIDQKIAELLEESKKLQEEPLFQQKADEGKKDVTAGASAPEGTNLDAAPTNENPDAKEAADACNDEIEDATSMKSNPANANAEAAEASHLKNSVKEDVDALVNGEELSEEFKAKAATIFEAAVVTRVKQEVARLEEQYDSQLAEQVESIKEGLIEKVDGYLNYVVEQWISDNELALESGMKNEILESFIEGMKGLFEQHYIEVPEEKFDVLGDLQEQVEVVEAKLNEQLESNVVLTKEINEMKRSTAISDFAVDMADTDAEKFRGLAEELAFEDVESFKTKLQTIKENYFGKKQTTVVESIVTDTPVQLNEDAPTVTGPMAHYLRALNGNK
jgi:cell division protein FtsB